MGVLAAALLYSYIPKDEGTVNKAYLDIVKVWTICTGDTYDVRPGQVASDAECRQRLEKQLIAHSKPVMACTPSFSEGSDPMRGYQIYAATDLSYNAGAGRKGANGQWKGGYCGSSSAQFFRQRRWVEGCNALRLWNRAGGRVVRGLDLRRRRAEQVCLTGLGPKWTPANLDARLKKVK